MIPYTNFVNDCLKWKCLQLGVRKSGSNADSTTLISDVLLDK